MRNNKADIKKLAIKARVYNQIRVDFFKKLLKEFSPGEKIAYFDKIFKLNSEAHKELNNYKANLKFKKKVTEARVKRGWKPKEKQPLVEKILVS